MRVGALLLCFVACAAFAANPKATALIKEGDRLYKENKYREAAEALKKAYDLEPAPTLLYNIARAYDQAGELKIALDYYRQFVGNEGADAALVKKANLAMDRLRTLVAKDEATAQLADAEKKRLEDEAKAAKEKAASEAEKARLQKEQYEAEKKAAQAASQSKSNTRLAISLVIGGVAVGALGTGIAFGVLAGQSKQQFTTAATVADKKRLQSETQTRALIADVGFGAALATAVIAVIVFPKGGSAEPAPAEKSVQVVFGPSSDGAFAGIRGSF